MKNGSNGSIGHSACAMPIFGVKRSIFRSPAISAARKVSRRATGQRPMTDAVYDLYWIVVDPSQKGKGIGKALLHHAENFVKELFK